LLVQGFESLSATDALNGCTLGFWPSEAKQGLLLFKCWCANSNIRCKQLLDSFILTALFVNASLSCSC
jgi:hypothetical protein